jgi:hypothetical protein
MLAYLMQQRARQAGGTKKAASVDVEAAAQLMQKEAIGYLAALGGLGKAMKAGWGGVAKGKATAGGLGGAKKGATEYMKHVSAKSPLTAAGLAATGAAVPAAGAGYLAG